MQVIPGVIKYFTTRLLSSFASDFASRPRDICYLSLQKRRRNCSPRLLAKAAKWKIATSKTGFSNLSKIVTVKETGIQGYSLRRRWFRPPAKSILTEINFFNFFGQPSSNPIFGPANSAQQFRFGAQDYLTPDLNFSQNCFGNNFSVLNSTISTTIEHRGAHNISATSFSLRHIQTNTWTAHLAGFLNPVEQFCRHSHLSLDQLRQTTFADYGKLELLEKIFAFLHIPHVFPLGFLQQFEAQHSLP